MCGVCMSKKKWCVYVKKKCGVCMSKPGLCMSKPGVCMSKPGVCMSKLGLCMSKLGVCMSKKVWCVYVKTKRVCTSNCAENVPYIRLILMNTDMFVNMTHENKMVTTTPRFQINLS